MECVVVFGRQAQGASEAVEDRKIRPDESATLRNSRDGVKYTEHIPHCSGGVAHISTFISWFVIVVCCCCSIPTT